MRIRAALLLAGLTASLAISGIGGAGCGAALADGKTDKAEALRKAAEAKTKRHIAYPDIFDYVVRDTDRTADFYYLSRQIEQLSRYLHDVSRSLGTATPPLSAGGGATAGDIASIYGPDGPTPKSVRLILEYRLLLAGNPRLTVGKVTDAGDAVTAEVVTHDGSLVDAYRIDKKTGAWTVMR